MFATLSRRLTTVVRPPTNKRFASTFLQNIETRWTKLPECEQGAIADRLATLQRGDWKKMSLEEKRAAYFIAYGPYGARQPMDPMFKYKVAGLTSVFLGLSFGIYFWWGRNMVNKRNTSTPEWIEAEKRLAVENKANPFTGSYAEYRKAQEKSQ